MCICDHFRIYCSKTKTMYNIVFNCCIYINLNKFLRKFNSFIYTTVRFVQAVFNSMSISSERISEIIAYKFSWFHYFQLFLVENVVKTIFIEAVFQKQPARSFHKGNILIMVKISRAIKLLILERQWNIFISTNSSRQ